MSELDVIVGGRARPKKGSLAGATRYWSARSSVIACARVSQRLRKSKACRGEPMQHEP
jgi:hypothetical protein